MNASLPLVDRIYEAAVIPELWPDVCFSLAEQVGAFSACVLTIDPSQTVRWMSTPNIDEPMQAYSQSETRFENVRPARSMVFAPSAFARDVDIMTDQEIIDDPIYNEFMRPLGLGWSMGAVFQEPSGHTLIFDLIGRSSNGPFTEKNVSDMNAIKGDLARAALLSSRLVFRQAQSITMALSLIGLPALVVGERNEVVAMNDDMEGLSPRIRTGLGNRLSLENAATSALLMAGLDEIRAGIATTVQSIPLAAMDGQPAVILHLLPVRRNACDIFSKSMAVVVATPVGMVGPPDLRVLSGLFDLTLAEARVARELASGASLDAVSLKLGLSLETVRTYLKRIFLKTGTRRQSELTFVLSGLGRVA